MGHEYTEQQQELIGRIITLLEQRLAPERYEMLSRFCHQYYAHVALEDLQELQPENLYGACLAHWNLARQRQADESLIRAYNPNYDEHGWQSTHTVIEIVTDDRPFLVDSIIMAINRHGLRAHLIIHPLIRVQRDPQGYLQQVTADEQSGELESMIHCEVDRQNDPVILDTLQQDLHKVIRDVRIAVEDWPAMQQRMCSTIADLDAGHAPCPAEQIEEIKTFLHWVAERNFIFLGCRDYDLVHSPEGLLLCSVPRSGLGVLRDDGQATPSLSFTRLPDRLRELATHPAPLLISKADARATVHRPVHMDYIGIKRFDAGGQVIGERRFLGLYTASAYTLSAQDIPLLRAKTRRMLQRSGLKPGSHTWRALQITLETFPRDELFQASEDDLFNTVMGILHLQERQRLRLFVREDLFQRFVSCLVYVPRDRYNTDLRERIQTILQQAFEGESSSFSTQFSESMLARVHFQVRTRPGQIPEYSVADLETRLREAMSSWIDNLFRALLDDVGEAQGNGLFQRYGEAFPAAYREDFEPRTGVSDIHRLESLSSDQPLAMWLYRPLEEPDGLLHFKVFGCDQPLPLSDVLPILECMGLRVISARPYELELADGAPRWVLNFDMREDTGVQVDVSEVKDIFREAFAQIWEGRLENDDFNRLVLNAHLDGRDISIVRAYSKYLQQTRITFSQAYMQQTLCQHPKIAKDLIALFYARFDPAAEIERQNHCATRAQSIEAALEHVRSLDEDRILRRFLAVIQATLRTNFFQADPHTGQAKDYIAFKFDPSHIPELPKPLPMFEIFVYSPRVEAVHLRGGLVARGGLRWSDRREDFRTEVLGLVKAQMVKNSVIVPVGSKGGFVVKRPLTGLSREAVAAEVQDCYRTFISGMLDITDNRVDDCIQPPPQVVRHDGDDPYLVVAADKGTATFSDFANRIAMDYGFWLGDAFASGGANGYDHKKMGITARGAWESVKRHFRELGLDIQNRDDFTVVGIGDMGGDVFGNGMLLSRHIKLVAAFNHLHIFLDPDPDPETSFQERQRLFNLPRSSWEDYNPELISLGGGVYPRSAKSIALSAEIRRVLDIQETRLTPVELINRLLKAPVDLLWNGGIGTYVKARSETHVDVGDKANDALRINGQDLRCRVVGEGGNLGLTQLGRIEFALKGGRILTDAIDNSGGVNCSDHEVNIKILLDQVIAAGDMTEKQRNTLLAEMTDEVAELVLRQNYLQPEAISVTCSIASDLLSDHMRVIRALERSSKLDRTLEYLPSDEILAEREAAGQGLVAPELAVLLAYSKITLYEALLDSDMPEDPFMGHELLMYFPSPLREVYAEQMQTHPLRREIIATYVTNSVLNRMGSTYVIRLQEDSGESVPDIARAYTVAREIYDARSLWGHIDGLDNQIPASLQLSLHIESRRLLERASQWLLRHRRPPLDIAAVVEQLRTGVHTVAQDLPALLQPAQCDELNRQRQNYLDQGVPESLASEIVSLAPLYAALDITDVADQADLPITAVAAVYFDLAETLQMTWLHDCISHLPASTHWQRRARAALLNGLYDQGRMLTAEVLRTDQPDADAQTRKAQWLERNQALIDRCLRLFDDLRISGQPLDLAMLSVALRETGHLLQAR